jgi:hypothetical protein
MVFAGNQAARGNQMNDRTNIELFAAEWERLQGYKPAPFQKAIALQRLQRGQSIREIIDALVAQRVQMPD